MDVISVRISRCATYDVLWAGSVGWYSVASMSLDSAHKCLKDLFFKVYNVYYYNETVHLTDKLGN